MPHKLELICHQSQLTRIYLVMRNQLSVATDYSSALTDTALTDKLSLVMTDAASVASRPMALLPSLNLGAFCGPFEPRASRGTQASMRKVSFPAVLLTPWAWRISGEDPKGRGNKGSGLKSHPGREVKVRKRQEEQRRTAPLTRRR